MKNRSSFVYVLAICFSVTGNLLMSKHLTVSAEQISQFRGPDGNGVYQATLPNTWSITDKESIAWVADVPGGGWSSPVSAVGHIFVTTAVSEDDTRPKGFEGGVQSMGAFFSSKPPNAAYRFEVHCFDEKDGNLIWKKEISSAKPPHKIHPSNSYATESPVSDGNHVYVYYAAIGVVACLDLSGDVVWQREIGAYKTGMDFGTGSSLALHQGMVFVQCDNEQESFIRALDCESGEEVWNKKRESRTSWSSPVIWENSQRNELLACGTGTITSYDPSTGEQLWKLTGLGGAFSASPTFDRERVYLGQSGRNSRGPLVAVKAGASGELGLDDLADPNLGWVVDAAGPGMSSPVCVDGLVYVLGRGILSCHDASSGERLYRERIKDASSVTSSLWSVGNEVFTMNESGETTVIKCGKNFEQARTNSLDGLFWSTPSSTNDALLVRSVDKLYCIRK